MQLDEKLDKQYKKDKKAYKALEKVEKVVKQAKDDLKVYTRMKEDAERKKQRAIEDKDKTEEKEADKEIEDADNKIEDTKSKIEYLQKIMKKNKEKVDSYIAELSKDPEFQAHINSILEKRYNRKMQKEIAQKEQTDVLIDLCKSHPQLENNLKGMIRATEEIKKLNEELSGLDITKDQTRIKEINDTEIPTLASKKEINEKIFFDFCLKNNIKIDKKFLKELIEEKGFKHDKKTGDIKVLNSLDRISKGYDKRIRTYQKAIEKIPGATVYEMPQPQNRRQEESRTDVGDESNIGTPSGNLPEKKFKWYQFRKRFKAWREKKNIEKQKKQNEGKTAESKSKFRNAYKYDVVKDYVDRKESEIYKEVSKERTGSNEERDER